MNTKISPQQILELLQTDGTFDKWKKQITDEFEKSEAEKVKSETRNHVFNSKTLANVTEYIHPKSSTAAYIYKDVQDEIMRSGFSDRIHSQVRRILQIEQDGNTNNNNNDTNASPFTTNLLDTVKSNIESAITKLQEPKTPKDIPTSTPPFQPTQPTAKLKSEPIKQESKLDILPIVKKEPPIKKSAPVVNINGKQHPTVPKKPSLQDPMKLPITPKEGTPKTPTTVPPIQTTAPSITPAAIVPPSTAPIPSQPATKPAAPAVMKPTKAINKAVESSSSSSESSDSDSSSSSSDSDTSDSSSDSDSDSSSSSSESDLDKKVVKKVLPSQSDSKPQNNLPNIQQEPKPVSIKKRSEKRKRKPKKSLESQDNNTDEGTHGGTPKEKKSRRGRLIKPSSWMVGDEESSVPLAKRRKKKRQEDVSGTNEVSPTPDEEDITSIRKKYYRRHKQQEEEQKELEATLEGKHVICIDKKGVIAGSLITCDCCSTAFNFSSFQEHAGCDTGNPWENIHVNDQEKQTLQYFYDQVEAKHSPKKKAKKYHIEDSQSSQIDTQSSQLDVQPATPPTPKSLSARRRKKHSMANSQDGNSSTNPSSGQTSVDDLRQRMKGILSEQELEDLIRMADPTDSGILDEAVCGELISQLQKKSETQGTTEVAT